MYMGKVLYRKYRPRKFSEAIGQEAIVQTLSDVVKKGRISHAYLFAGPRGVGKTSLARILAHEINNLAYVDDQTHLDIIEIDAASNRRVDEIRDLREKVHVAPAAVKYKVYIIDEVHMLTKEAFNALLKTLEEPPAHIVFILATTEPHKLPETIISRTQRFNFKPIDAENTYKLLRQIAKKEKIEVDDEALKLISSHGDGSLRDIIGLLDQLSSAGSRITLKEARNLLGIPAQKSIQELIKAILSSDHKAALSCLADLKQQGANAAVVAASLSKELRQKLLNGQIAGSWVINLMAKLLDITSSPYPQEALELAILEAVGEEKDYTNSDIQKPNSPNSTEDKTNFDISQWEKLLKMIQSETPSLYSALRLATPRLVGDRLQLSFRYPLHQKKVQEARHIHLIAKQLEKLTSNRFRIECVVERQIDSQPQPPPMQTINRIFGTAEMLES